jgi:FMN phosphatase YigB (HAD superfamily)
MHSEKIAAVLFDLDDTLFDRQRTQPAVLDGILRELPELFAGLDRREIANAFYLSDRQGLEIFNQGATQDQVRLGRSEAFLRLLNLPPGSAQLVADEYTRQYPLVGRPVSGAKQLLAELVHKYPLGLVSNGFADMQQAKLESLGFAGFFDCLTFSAQAGFRKPHPKIFQQAACKLGLTPVECLYVGDSYEDDVLGARAAGMKTCWYNPEGVRLKPGSQKPDFEIGALSAVARLVLRE